MNNEHVIIPLKQFLLISKCPPLWGALDLYVFRDDNVAFYVGQSHLAFDRVWEHLLSGFKGNSMMGRFVWCNWPRSMSFTIELLSSRSAQFCDVQNDLNASERMLIRHWSPCFNISLNQQPTSLPASYLPPNAPFRRRQSFTTLLYQAEQAVKADEKKRWLEETES